MTAVPAAAASKVPPDVLARQLALWAGVALFPMLFAWFVLLGEHSPRAKLTAVAMLLAELGLAIYALEPASLLQAVRMLRG